MIRGDGKERFKINEPFMVCMRRARNNNWKIERVFRASAMRLSTLGITAENALKKLMGD
ncbi:MAG: hypothetical protein HUN05_19085 [Desulfobacter sp.]|nr:MAG: hypothetical protein HUN05_19085 [Desulfobacter sp.]